MGQEPLMEALSGPNITAATLLLENRAEKISYINSGVISSMIRAPHSREVYEFLFSRCIDYAHLGIEYVLNDLLKLASSYGTYHQCRPAYG
jgi:hypothetical protein